FSIFMKINNYGLIIGAMKCGTTSLFDYLSQHPEIAPCSQKEPHFFSKSTNYSLGYDYYQSLWNWNPQQHKIALEATPGYTKITHQDSASAAENIALVQSEQKVKFKFIYIMRHPLERIESHYVHEAAKSNRQHPHVVSKIEQRIIDTSKYALQISEFYQWFSPDNILLLNFENLKSNPDELLKKVCQFLEIDPEFTFNKTRTIHNSREQLRMAIPGWRNLRKTSPIQYIKKNISSQQKNVVKSLLGRKTNVDFQLDSQLKSDIIDELKPDLLKLCNEYRFDIQSWQLDL
ncbi:MAG: sulfotransferase domain-containing protein, partial [Cyanobacteria bacterium J06600_6]